MLGSRAEAEDAVQEAWLRYAGARDRAGEIRDLRGWLTTTTGAHLPRRAAVRAGAPGGVPRSVASGAVGQPAAVSGARPGRDGRAQRRGRHWRCWSCWSGSRPEQRVAFVLHDVFAVPFEEIASALGTHRAGGPAARLAGPARGRRRRAPAHRRPGRAAAGAERVPDGRRARRPRRAAGRARARRGGRSATAAASSPPPASRWSDRCKVARFVLRAAAAQPAGRAARCSTEAGAGQRRAGRAGARPATRGRLLRSVIVVRHGRTAGSPASSTSSTRRS